MALNSIEKEWAGFSAMIFKGMTPGPSQVAEMKKAFFAGAAAMIAAYNELADPAISVAEGVVYIENCVKESQAFYDRMMAEYAEKN